MYDDADPLTNARTRGHLLCDRFEEVGVVAPGRVLDLGCGYGGVSLAFRDRGYEMYPLDRDVRNVRVVLERTAGSGAPPVNASALELPFRDATFQTVIMVGVLEWVGFSRPTGDPRAMQVDALREVRRVLRPQGRLLLATKNRLFPRFAWRDAQLQVPVLNWIPHRLADLAVRRRRGYGYRARIYRAAGWSTLLRDAGLRVQRGWSARYTYQYPLSFAPFDGRGSTAGVVEQRAAALSDVERREAFLSANQGARRRYYDTIERFGIHRHLAMSLVFEASPAP